MGTSACLATRAYRGVMMPARTYSARLTISASTCRAAALSQQPVLTSGRLPWPSRYRATHMLVVSSMRRPSAVTRAVCVSPFRSFHRAHFSPPRPKTSAPFGIGGCASCGRLSPSAFPRHRCSLYRSHPLLKGGPKSSRSRPASALASARRAMVYDGPSPPGPQPLAQQVAVRDPLLNDVPPQTRKGSALDRRRDPP